MKGTAIAAACVIGSGILISGGTAKAPAITQTSIAGAKLGLPASACQAATAESSS
jgi:1-aminocyclopropane-1-carboxylate deaminase/D-cysteine desulfhydrase-like pyridoxal-dependent ACC family enzyme